ncbi:LysR family transcriptional regulator, partial [bacterium]|nr:LysR family transcriptional regulator [candidate division CSSED10-310 bacterium]
FIIMNPQLDLQQLRAFYFLARTGSYTATARRLSRTQSAISHAIRKLEESAGVKLVDRSGSRFQLSEEGRRLFAACESVFSTLERVAEDISHLRGGGRGLLRLGATVEFGSSILMQHMGPFLKAHPDLDVEFHMHHELLAGLLRDDLDIIIDCKEHQQPELERVVLFREAYVIVAAPEYCRSNRLIAIEDLGRTVILSLDRELTWWHRLLFSLPPENRPCFDRVIPINHIRGMIVAARHGLGVALVPKYSVLTELGEGSLEMVFPSLDLHEDRFCIYQKLTRKHLLRHQLLISHLLGIRPREFGSK